MIEFKDLVCTIEMKNKPSILFVNTFQKSGGAARAAFRLWGGIRGRYPDSLYLTLFKESRDASIVGLRLDSVGSVLAKKFKPLDDIPIAKYKRLKSPLDFSPAFWANPMRTAIGVYSPKIIHLNWIVSGMLTIGELSKIKVPIVWTLHDMWAFTGGCHYAGSCVGFRNACGACPELGSKLVDDYSSRLFKAKLKVFDSLDITVVAPSNWLAGQARDSLLFRNKRIEVIPNGINLNSFRPIDTYVARDFWGIPKDHKVILFGANHVGDRRKGADLLVLALAKINFPATLLTFGDGRMDSGLNSNVVLRSLGSLSDDASLALAYSAADMFICPSREDNLPNTIMEALSCGTPCVAFNSGGISDMIQHRKTGWLADCFDVDSLVAGIMWVASIANAAEVRRSARDFAEFNYGLTRVVDRYTSLYSSVESSL